MTDKAPAVALLFDDTELGGQLRSALNERGARIVHEGVVSSLDRERLREIGADVLVVNLDDSADDALDSLYELIDGDRPRVVFNDAQASRALEGWDRARWARHLAVKVLAAGDIDPPRPTDARDIEAVPADLEQNPATAVAPAPAEEIPAAAEPAAIVAAPTTETQLPDEPDDLLEPGFSMRDDRDGEHEKAAAEESENLAAELEALLASGDLPVDEDETGPGLRYAEEDELPPLHDGNFGVPDSAEDAAAPPPRGGEPPAAASFPNLQLESLVDPEIVTIPASADAPAVIAAAAPQVSAPSGWALLDEDAEPFAAGPKIDSTAFGIEKISAADFLAPDAEPVAADLEPVFNLELVSIEEAVAPQPYLHDHEMVLDELGSALSRIVLLGAAASGLDSACIFLQALPADSRLTLLHTQHLGPGQSDETVLERLAASCPLPVRLAEQGNRAGAGEVLLAPAGKQVLLRRDGKIELQVIGTDDGAMGASIDGSFTMAANAFGRDALAIVFAGRANDAVAGAQAVHDRGGQVWVESSSGEHFADMVSGIFAERLVSFSGTPPELAAHLIEVFS